MECPNCREEGDWGKWCSNCGYTIGGPGPEKKPKIPDKTQKAKSGMLTAEETAKLRKKLGF